MADQPWREYEKLVGEIQRQMAPGAIVRHAERIVGKSGVERKIDVTLRQTIGPYPMLIVFDCKRHSRPVELSDVAAFADQRTDVGASLGVIISNSGFSEGAVKVAAGHGVMLQTLRQAQAADWQDLLGGNAWVNLSKVDVRDFRCEARSDGEFEPLPAAVLFNIHGQAEANLSDDFFEAWNHRPIPPPLGPIGFEMNLDMRGPALFAIANERTQRVRSVRLSGTLVARLWVVNLNLAEGHVLSDEPNGGIVYQQMTSASFDWQRIVREEPGIEIDENQLATVQSSTALNVPLDNAKQFLRVVVSRTPKKSDK